jgi:hypothetical protein
MCKQVSKHDFDLRTREEASRTCPDAVSKINVVNSGGGMLVLQLVSRDLAESRKAEGFEFSGVRVQFWVEVDGVA